MCLVHEYNRIGTVYVPKQEKWSNKLGISVKVAESPYKLFNPCPNAEFQYKVSVIQAFIPFQAVSLSNYMSYCYSTTMC